MLKLQDAAGRLVAFCLPLGIALAATILLLHVALLPEAHWQGDDFLGAAFARDFRSRFLWVARIGRWSPRPFSEILFYGFLRTAETLRQPVTVPFLALLWSMLLASTLVTCRAGAIRILIGLATCCLFLLGHPVAEMFYWPAGAVAYLSTLAATSLALFLLVDGRAEGAGGALAVSASLVTCAASSESGALAIVPLALALAAAWPDRRCAPLLLAPLLVTGFVVWTLATHRLGPAVGQAAPLRHLLRSLWPMPLALLNDVRSSWAARLLFALGVRWCWPLVERSRAPHPALPAFAAALAAGAAATISAALFQTDNLCCERQDTLRQGWVILAIVALAVWSTRRWAVRPRLTRLGPATLLAACLLGAAPRLPGFIGDFRLMPAIIATDHGNWRAGRAPGTSAMLFRLPPAAAIAGAPILPPGRYAEPAENAWFAHGIMSFFGKRSLVIQLPGAGLPGQKP